MTTDKLTMRFEPNTIEHLGIRMYSQLPKVLAELISNAYDADAEVVIVKLVENRETGEKSIVVDDDGIGLSFQEINDEFLTIGRNRREKNDGITAKGRKVMGKKGIGKLAFFGIAKEIIIETKRNGVKNVFVMDWDKIKNSSGVYEPEIKEKNVKCSPKEKGTIITLRKFTRKIDFDVDKIERNLARLFVVTEDFKILLSDGKKLTKPVSNKPHYKDIGIEFTWKIPNDLPKELSDVKKYFQAKGVFGELYTAKAPIRPNAGLSGVILFSRKKMVNAPSNFSSSESSHFFSYLAGYLEVDFIDDIKEDVISTDRQSLIWDSDEMDTLHNNIQKVIRWLEIDWRRERKSKKQEEMKLKSSIDTKRWYGTVPENVQKPLKDVVEWIVDVPEISDEESRNMINKIHDMIPEYARFHWRTLHAEVADASGNYYQKADYYQAFAEAVKRYESEVKKAINSVQKGRPLMEDAFGKKGKIKIGKKFKNMKDKKFKDETIDGIEEGQKLFSAGLMAGYRNPLSHEEIKHIEEEKLFIEMDCLDGLSLLSHLFRRLDNAKHPSKKPTPIKKQKDSKPKKKTDS